MTPEYWMATIGAIAIGVSFGFWQNDFQAGLFAFNVSLALLAPLYWMFRK